MKFEEALSEMKKGKYVRRIGTNLVFFIPRGEEKIKFFDSEDDKFSIEANFFQTSHILEDTWEVVGRGDWKKE